MDSLIVKPISILGIMVLLQALLTVVLVIGVWLDHSNVSRANRAQSMSLLVIFTPASIAILVFTNEFYVIWQPLVNDFIVPTLSREHAVTLVFAMNYLCIVLLIIHSGGARQSPFIPVLFLLPTLIIFLRQPPHLIVGSGILTAVYYVWTTMNPPRLRSTSFSNWEQGELVSSVNAHRFVTLSCLALTVFAGYLTRPSPV